MTTTIAQTILAQLGGNRFRTMTGARNFLDGGNALQFDLPANFARAGINKVRISLEVTDTYTLTFYKVRRRGLECKTIDEVPDVYADSLRQVFTGATGLNTSL